MTPLKTAAKIHPQEDYPMFDVNALDDFLMPNAEEIMELTPYEEDDYLQDVPAFRDAIQEAMLFSSRITDDARATAYGA